ncbi:hypothetical protein DITRI_Ditri01bG0167100 [Diplodiscus trichospermus]
MSSQVSQILASPVNAISSNMENRPKADFHPGIWGDMFLNCPDKDIDATTEKKYEELKEDVRKMIVAPVENCNQKLMLIDAVQRLGVSYHFEKEIADALEAIYHDSNDVKNDLYTTSLRFRLLREHGYNSSCEVFNKFKDEEGHFKSALTNDVRGLLELYEASYMRVHGEDILDEAISFTTTYLTPVAATSEYPLSEQVAHALKQSIRRGMPRVEARRYISIYPDLESPNKALLEFAKIDFNMLQLLHRKELCEFCRWWKDLDFAQKLPFARNRLVECYFWILGVYFEPQYGLAREILTKTIVMASTMDDIYDVYGTFEELQLFTNAIERLQTLILNFKWDAACIDQLPTYMKVFYKALLNVFEEMEEAMTKEGKLYRVQYAKEAMKQLSQAYFVEAKWCNEHYTPTVEEYMTNAVVSSGYIMVAITSLVRMGDIVTEEVFNWASTNPKIIKASAIIARLMDDIVSHKFEQERGHVASAIECYMKQHGVGEEKAIEEFNNQIDNAWKDINQELVMRPTARVPMPVLTRILNLARVMDFLYKEGDGYTHVGHATRTGITSLLIDPISI